MKTRCDNRMQFLLDQAGNSAVAAAFQHARVYDPIATATQRFELRGALKAALVLQVKSYERPGIDDDKHIAAIEALSDEMTAGRASELQGGRFRIGIAQKALNLYLKYLWCLDLIPTPPHCPFDRTVIEQLPSTSQTNWTKLDSADEYLELVAAAREAAGGLSLAEWELGLWSAGHSAQ